MSTTSQPFPSTIASIAPIRFLLGLSLTASVVIALEVTLTRIFSITIWYHFAYLVVGVALLGGGAAGTMLAVRNWSVGTLATRSGAFAAAFSLSIVICLAVITLAPVDPLGGDRAALIRSAIGLLLYFTATFGMFFLGGLTVTAAFRVYAADSHRLYFADLLGASLSTLLVTVVIRALGGPNALLALAALAAGAGGLLALPGATRQRLMCFGLSGVLLAGLVAATATQALQLPVPPSKELGSYLRDQGVDRAELTAWNPVARVDVLPKVSTSDIWIAGGASSLYFKQNTHKPRDVRFISFDGTSASAIHDFSGGLPSFKFLEYTVASAAYHLGDPPGSVLNIGVGGGLDIVMARYFGAGKITAIELNSDAVAALKDTYADFSGRLIEQPNTTLQTAEGRSFLTRDPGRYDVIQGIALDNFAALSGGAYVLAESYLYTTDAIDLALSHLTPDGVYAWTRSTNEPPREMLRLAGVAAQALRNRGVANPAAHILIVANEPGDTATILASPSPFSAERVASMQTWAAANGFKLLHDPLTKLDTIYADYLTSPDPRAYERAYPFNIAPVDDDAPFFFNYFKWTKLLAGSGSGGDVNTRWPIGNIILLLMLAMSLIAALVFVIIPLLRYRRAGLRADGAGQSLAYFSALGAGYMFLQVVLIQRFTLFIGYPTQAITTTIFSMLVFAAAGSLLARRLIRHPRDLMIVFGLLLALIAAYAFGLPAVLRAGLTLPDVVRVVASVALIAPLAVLLGMPFPTGLELVSRGAPERVPWAWGMNGVFSVIGSALVVLVSMLSSFTVSFMAGLAIYALAALLSLRLWPSRAAG